MRLLNVLFFILFLGAAMVSPAMAQHEGHEPEPEPEKEQPAQQQEHHDEHAGMSHGVNAASQFLMQQPSGTAVGPASSHTHNTAFRWRGWDAMVHGIFSLNAIQQTGPRGDDRVFSTNWAMLMATKELDTDESLMFRTMLSLEPATVTDRQYPLLFQTGETAFDQPIVDGQHPHDFFMELAAQYALEISDQTIFHIYGALVGDPALGPVGFPHRISAIELPQATLSHHLQDSTHIANDVITVGVARPFYRFEVSAFHGAEPDEGRWDIDFGAIDSWSTRFSVTPNPNWVAQVSIGRLKEPEAAHPGDAIRSTASVTYYKAHSDGMIAGSFIWGRNRNTLDDVNLDSFLFEGVYQFRDYNYITARFENVEKDELFANEENEDDDHHHVFRINAFTIGYTRDLPFVSERFGIGGNMTFYAIPSELDDAYGDNPFGFLLYVRHRFNGIPW